MDGRWMLKSRRVRVDKEGRKREGLLISAFGYKNHASIYRRHGFIQRMKVTDAASHNGVHLQARLADPN